MSDSRALRALRDLLPRIFPREPYLGPRRYRVVRMRPSASSATLTRVELQAVSTAAGLPDMLLVTMAPGVAGALPELTPGAVVLVQFIDGDPALPIITHFATADDPAWRAVNLTIDATGTIRIGPSAASIVLASGSDSITVPTDAAGRVLRAGDIVMMPVGSPPVPTGVALILTQNVGDVVPTGPVSASKVQA